MNKFLATVNKKLKDTIKVQKWITINGTHVPIGDDGEPKSSVGKKIEKQEKSDKEPSSKKASPKEKAEKSTGKRKPGQSVSEASDKAINNIEAMGLKFETVHDGDDLGVAVVDDKGKTIGSAILRPDGKGGLKAHPYQQIKVDKEYRRKGIASGMYAFAEKQTGLEMKPSESQTSFGKAIWENPKKPFGGQAKSEKPKAENKESKPVKVNNTDKEAAIDALAGGVKDKDWSKFTKEFEKQIAKAKQQSVTQDEASNYYRSHSETMEDNSQHRSKTNPDHNRGTDVKDPSIAVSINGKHYMIDGQHRFNQAINAGKEANVVVVDGSFLEKFGIDESYFAGKKNNSNGKKMSRLKAEVKKDLFKGV